MIVAIVDVYSCCPTHAGWGVVGAVEGEGVWVSGGLASKVWKNEFD